MPTPTPTPTIQGLVSPLPTAEQDVFKRELDVFFAKLYEHRNKIPPTPIQAPGTTITTASAGTVPAPVLATTPEPSLKDVQSWIAILIGDVDTTISGYLSAVFHHPDFQALESTWRGLKYLVDNTDTGPLLKIKILNASKEELSHDLGDESSFYASTDQSALFKKVYEEEYGQLGGQPYGVLVGDYEFNKTSSDVCLLENISNVAADAHAPFVAAASPQMFKMNSFAELGTPRDLSRIFDSDEYIPWNSFRDKPESRYVALTVPRVLCRPPYGTDDDHGCRRVEEFDFVEDVAANSDSKFLWMNAAWAYAARLTEAYSLYGWLARTRGVDTGGLVDGLPFYMFNTDDGDWAVKPPVQCMISDRREFELSNMGFLPLVYRKHSQSAVFLGSQSCQKPQLYFEADANANAELSAKFNLILCVSRFAHYLKIMARNKIGSFMEVKDCSDWLNGWIRNYVVSPKNVGETTKAKFPLSSARVDVAPVDGKPGWYECVAYLRPHFQLETLTASLRLVAEVPQLGS